jgi:hypothetical protein
MFSFPGELCGSSKDEGGGIMLRKRQVLPAIMLCLIGAAAWASETISYKYDARGRLVKVQRSGSVNNNVTANYSYDKGDNRTNVNVASPNPAP